MNPGRSAFSSGGGHAPPPIQVTLTGAPRGVSPSLSPYSSCLSSSSSESISFPLSLASCPSSGSSALLQGGGVLWLSPLASLFHLPLLSSPPFPSLLPLPPRPLALRIFRAPPPPPYPAYRALGAYADWAVHPPPPPGLGIPPPLPRWCAVRWEPMLPSEGVPTFFQTWPARSGCARPVPLPLLPARGLRLML